MTRNITHCFSLPLFQCQSNQSSCLVGHTRPLDLVVFAKHPFIYQHGIQTGTALLSSCIGSFFLVMLLIGKFSRWLTQLCIYDKIKYTLYFPRTRRPDNEISGTQIGAQILTHEFFFKAVLVTGQGRLERQPC